MKTQLDAIQREFQGLALHDERLNQRAVCVVGRLGSSPADSFPEQMSSEAELEGLYRFTANPKVSYEGLLAPHVAATVERIRGRQSVRVIHDTTMFRFEGDREGLGILMGNTKGFLAHFSLAVSADDDREPLGVIGVRPYIHTTVEERKPLTPSQRLKASRALPRAKRESSRWEDQAIETSALLPDETKAIHVMDQGMADFFALATCQQQGLRFVVRANPKRKTKTIGAKDVLATQTATVFRTVRVTERKHYKNRSEKHPIRAERDAALELRWGPITLGRGQYVEHEFKELKVNAVHVFEPSPPTGDEAIEWMLFTSEPVTTLEEATAIVDHYRARWIIEEYFKALKTGCSIEKRQLTSYDALKNALGLFIPIAWHLLLLRHLSREAPTRSAETILDREQLRLLRALLEERRHKLATRPTVRDVMLAIARLGGHIRNNGDPGWQVLGRGFVRFSEAETVWRLARRSDQS